jgi:hypothetical protein
MLDIEIERDDVGWVMRIDRGSNGCLGGGVALCCFACLFMVDFVRFRDSF